MNLVWCDFHPFLGMLGTVPIDSLPAAVAIESALAMSRSQGTQPAPSLLHPLWPFNEIWKERNTQDQQAGLEKNHT